MDQVEGDDGMPGPKPQNIKGVQFGRLTALKIVGKTNGRVSVWECECECGKIHTASISQLRNGQVKSCGCLKRVDVPVATERLFRIWMGIKQRCNNPNDKAYKYYGGRGIALCDEWSEYKNFRKWAHSNGYNETLTIDRSNNDLGYSPDNCRWASMKEQNRNKRSNIYVIYEGKKITLGELAHQTGLSLPMLHRRYKAGYRDEKLWTNKHLQTNQAVKIDLEDGSSRQR